MVAFFKYQFPSLFPSGDLVSALTGYSTSGYVAFDCENKNDEITFHDNNLTFNNIFHIVLQCIGSFRQWFYSFILCFILLFISIVTDHVAYHKK